MSGQGMWQVQVKSEMLTDAWNDLSDHSSEANARESADRYRIAHPSRQYRILRFVVAETLDIEEAPATCSCPQSDTYRQLVPTCGGLGHEHPAAERQGNEGS